MKGFPDKIISRRIAAEGDEPNRGVVILNHFA